MSLVKLTKQSLKRVYLTLFLVFLLFISIGIIISDEFDTDVEINQHIDSHLKLVGMANETSGYAKRAEGHLFLYLMLENPADRDKFFKRVEKIRELVQQMNTILPDNEELQMLDSISSETEKLEADGNKLLELFDQSKAHKQNQNQGMDFSGHAAIIKSFHDSSSKIRKLGVELVNHSTGILNENTNKINDSKKLNLYSQLLLIFITLTILVLLVYQSGKLTSSIYYANKLSELSYLDGLTGVSNRRKFDEEFLHAWKYSLRSQQPFCLIIIDVDYFKAYNDHYGHIEGDNCLIAIANTLKTVIKRETDVLARYGGEEFIMILNTPMSQCENMAKKCLTAVQALGIKHELSEVSDVVTISVGAGLIEPSQDKQPSDELKRIDQALYKAKKSGRNRFVIA